MSARGILQHPDKFCIDMRILQHIQKDFSLCAYITRMPDIQAGSAERYRLVQALSSCVDLSVLRQKRLSTDEDMINPVHIIDIQ